MALKPLADRIVIEPIEAETKTAGGIFIPDNAKEKPQRGKVISVGAGRRSESGELIPAEVKKDDTVLYGKYAGTEITYEGKDYLIVRESDILAIL
jgi:chaperonin GroES